MGSTPRNAGITNVTLRAVAALLLCLSAAAQATGDLFGQHHSAATQVTPDNVTQLDVAWTHRNGDMAAQSGQPSSVSAQSTPILLPRAASEHPVYCAPFNRVIALDLATGAERWSYDPQACKGAGVTVSVTRRSPAKAGLVFLGKAARQPR